MPRPSYPLGKVLLVGAVILLLIFFILPVSFFVLLPGYWVYLIYVQINLHKSQVKWDEAIEFAKKTPEYNIPCPSCNGTGMRSKYIAAHQVPGQTVVVGKDSMGNIQAQGRDSRPGRSDF